MLKVFGKVDTLEMYHRSIVLAMGEVLGFGFNLAVSFPSDSRGSKALIVLLPSRIKRWSFHHIA